jgi:hypothetical protein
MEIEHLVKVDEGIGEDVAPQRCWGRRSRGETEISGFGICWVESEPWRSSCVRLRSGGSVVLSASRNGRNPSIVCFARLVILPVIVAASDCGPITFIPPAISWMA